MMKVQLFPIYVHTYMYICFSWDIKGLLFSPMFY